MRKGIIIFILLGLLGAALWLGFMAGERGFGLGSDAKGVERREAAGGSEGDKGIPASDLRRTVTNAAGEVRPTASPQAPTGGEMLQGWLTSSQDSHEIAANILRGFPALRTEDHAMVAKELIPLVTDDRYEGLKRLLLDPKTSHDAKNLIFKNLIRRPMDLHLPLYLTILRQTPPHPNADEARNLLYVRLGQDYGTDWAAWQAGINEQLAR
jgi:hypothetical protein